MLRGFLLLSWPWFWLGLCDSLSLSERQDLHAIDMVCVFPAKEDPQEIVRYLTHSPHIKLNLFYWHLSDLGFNAASLSLPSHLAIGLGEDFGAECEPVRMMVVASRYTQAIRQKYQSRRKTLEKTLQCTISYDTYDQLLQHADSTLKSRNKIVSRFPFHSR
jgi:hypothetical protein